MNNGESSYRRFLSGDEDGFCELVRDYKDGLILYLNGFVKNISAAEELAEETFVKLALKRPRFSGLSSFKTWLYSIGKNLALDYLKNNSKHPVSLDGDLAETELIENSFFKKEQNKIIHNALNRLKDDYRIALWLFYFEGLHNKDIAKIIKRSVHSTETLLYRARAALKDELLKGGFDFEDL